VSEEGPEAAFKPGDAVQHKTGGPKMIYIGQDDLQQCICTWMSGSKKQTDTFHVAELAHYEGSGPMFTTSRA
jgi:uncharacterized protein YodC (DUF2158 family)